MNTKHILDVETVVPWAKASLGDGLAQRLARAVSQQANLSQTKYSVLADSTLSDSALSDFGRGGKVSGLPTADEWLLEFLKTQSSDTFVVASDWTVKRGAEFLQKRSMPAAYHWDEVYYIVPTELAGRVPNWRRIVSNTVPLFHAFVVRGVAVPDVGSQIGGDLIDDLARHVQAIIFGVYDGESYLTAELRS